MLGIGYSLYTWYLLFIRASTSVVLKKKKKIKKSIFTFQKVNISILTYHFTIHLRQVFYYSIHTYIHTYIHIYIYIYINY